MRILALGAAVLILATACGGSSGSSTPSPAVSPTAAQTPAPTVASVRTQAAVNTPAPDGTPFTAAQATSLLEAAMLKPADLPAAGGWKVATDAATDNSQAATADPTSAASNERCKRLLGRTVTIQPADITTTYINGSTVTFFTSGTVYAMASGAADCAAESATRYQKAGELARAFGTVFTEPDNVIVTPVDFPTIGDGSFAVTLAGRTNANGLVVDLTILAVGFRQGAVNLVVGSAAAANPSVDELKPIVTMLAQRVAASQQ